MKSEETEGFSTPRVNYSTEVRTSQFPNEGKNETEFDPFNEFIANVCQDIYTALCENPSNMNRINLNENSVLIKGE
jgi:hypothetical protein